MISVLFSRASFMQSIRRLICTGSLLVLASGIVLTQASAAVAASGGCPAAYDADSASEATLQACGNRAFPLASVTDLAGGGHAYHYQMEGMEATTRVPPASFQPAHASAAELSLYGIQAPPLDSPERTLWDAKLSQLHMAASPPSRRVVIPSSESYDLEEPSSGVIAGNSGSKNWDGYVNTSGSQEYNEARVTFTEPSPSITCANAAEVSWDGLGGFKTHNLAQNGTAYNSPGLNNHQAWWEILPAGAVGVPEHATAGQRFEAETHYEGHNEFRFFVYNYADSSYWTEWVKTTNGIDRSTADFIVERPKVGGKFRTLADFGSVPMTGYTNNQAIAAYPYENLRMESNKAVIANAAGIPPSTREFTASWLGCGIEEA